MKKITSLLIILTIFLSCFKINAYCLQISKFENKSVYITFDDGPNSNTPKILDLLNKYDMKATFFLLESKINLYPEIVTRILNEGHSVGLHGQSHEKSVFYANDTSVLNEINSTRNTLLDKFGYNTKLVRVPYGSKPHLTNTQYSSLINSGYKIWDWNIDSTDTYQDANASSIVDNTLSKLNKNGNSIILFHEKQITVSSLSTILAYIKNNNYESKIITQDQVPMNWWNRNLK